MRRQITFFGCVFVLLLVFSTVAEAATAQGIPSEAYHPVAAAHRRLAFFVNLDPVPWDLVETETNRIVVAFEGVAKAEGLQFQQAVHGHLQNIAIEASISSPTPTLREETARAIFELSTRAVTRLIELHLSETEQQLGDQTVVDPSFETARHLWQAFVYEVSTSDAAGFRNVETAWGSALDALGMGTTPFDSEDFGKATFLILHYVNANFGADFRAPDTGRLVAVPVHSPTYDASFAIPPKLPPGSLLEEQQPRPRQRFHDAGGDFDEASRTEVARGKRIFESPLIFGEPARSLGVSCDTCHNEGATNPNFFIPGLSSVGGGMDVNNSFFAPHANNGVFDPVDIPDLRGIRFTAPYGRNGRFGTLREFSRNVIVNEFGGTEPTPETLDGLVAYMNTLDFLPNPKLDSTGRLRDQVNDAARRGEGLFNRVFPQMNDKSCATCHLASRHFADGQLHDIGSVVDIGSYSGNGELDTPTLLSSLYTAPYFRDGSLPTLRSVVHWFNEHFVLGLSNDETEDLTAYVTAVGSGEEAYED